MTETILKCDRCKKETPRFYRKISVEYDRNNIFREERTLTFKFELCEKCKDSFNEWLKEGAE